jgi:phosphoglycerate dehydrogenase-like enzyme
VTTEIVVLDDYENVAHAYGDWDTIPDTRIRVFNRRLGTADELVDGIGSASVLVAMRERTRIDDGLLTRLPELRLLVVTGSHNNRAVDIAAARRQGITVCGTGGGFAAAGELTWALILGLAKQVTQADACVRAGQPLPAAGKDLNGARLGVVGFGKLGRAVARVGEAFGMDVATWSPNIDESYAAGTSVRVAAKKELFAGSDFVTLHMVYSRSTERMIGAEELGWMSPSAYFVNTSRGRLVDEEALIACLQSGRIAGAGLDVFWQEPLSPQSPLTTLPNVLLSPHVGYATEGTLRNFYCDIVEDIREYLAGRPARMLAVDNEGAISGFAH